MSQHIEIGGEADGFTVSTDYSGEKCVIIDFSEGHRKEVLVEVSLIINADMLRDIVAETSSVHD